MKKMSQFIISHIIFTGNYFSTTFIMGGEKFNTPSPENYLFGENTDLNFLTAKPTSVSKVKSGSHQKTPKY